MNNKTTVLLLTAVGCICAVIGIGFATSQPAQPTKKQEPIVRTATMSEDTLLARLPIEQVAITSALIAAIPQITDIYTVERGKLYDQGQWYGAVLQYKGTDMQSRDTLRLVMKKENGVWELKTTPPQPLVSAALLPDAPLAMLNDINRPATLKGTENSPTIIPGE